MLMFSGAQLHSSVPNTSGKTRWSIDFRTVHLGDAAARRGAPRSDEACTGTTMRDYLRASDHQRLPEPIIAMYNDGSEDEGRLVYDPFAAAAVLRHVLVLRGTIAVSASAHQPVRRWLARSFCSSGSCVPPAEAVPT